MRRKWLSLESLRKTKMGRKKKETHQILETPKEKGGIRWRIGGFLAVSGGSRRLEWWKPPREEEKGEEEPCN